MSHQQVDQLADRFTDFALTARVRSVITASAHGDSGGLGGQLEEEYKVGRGLLSALVVRRR
jgi:hypothetical protein